jgi:DNA polymerase III delta subunit
VAVPNPDREHERLGKALQSGLPPVLIVTGASDFFRQEAIDMVAAVIPDGVDLRNMDGDTKTDGRELNDLCGGTLFGSGAVLVVRRGESWLKAHGEGLLASIPSIAKGSSLVLEVKKLDKRTKLAKALVKAGEFFEFRDLYTEPYDRTRSPLDAEMVGWLVRRSRTLQCPLQAEAAFMVMSVVGTKPAELVEEVERIRNQLGKRDSRKALGPEDLRGSLTCSFQSNPFELADAVLAFDRKAATRALGAMYARGTTGRDGKQMDRYALFPFITSWLYRSLSQVYEGRCLMDTGVALRDVPGRVGVRQFVDRFQGQLKKNPTHRIQRGLQLLHSCQRELRTSGEEPEWLLLRFLRRYFAEAEAVA